ncbi:MAG: endo-1,4-beta-xylanase [Firmicutes bacterium]|nr:endo-1,4-beta-xylanase [Bacillota bacterium]
MKNKKIVQKAGSKFLAMMLSVAMVVPGTAFVPAEYSGAIEALAATIDIAEDFESGDPKGHVRGSGTLTVVEEGHAGKALQLSGRTQKWHTYAYDVSAYAGATANISVFMKTEDKQIVCEVTGTGSDSKDYYNWLLNTNVKGGEWTALSGTVTIPEGAKELYFSTGEGTGDYLIDDVNIEIVEAEASEGAVSKDYTFDKLTQAAEKEDTGATAAIGEDGKLSVTMTRQYGQVFFRLPKELDGMIITGIRLNVAEGSSQAGLSPKLLSEADFNTEQRNGDVGVAYGTNTLNATSDDLGKTARYVGIMTNSEATPITMKFDSITINAKSAERVIDAKKDIMAGFNGNFENTGYWNDGEWRNETEKDSLIAYCSYSEKDPAPKKTLGSKYMRASSVSANTVSPNGLEDKAVVPTVQMNYKTGIKADKAYEFTYYARIADAAKVSTPKVSMSVLVHDSDYKNQESAQITYDENYELTDAWQKVSGTMVIAENANELPESQIRFEGSAGITFDIDNLQIAEMRIPKVDMTIRDLHEEVQKTGNGVEYMGVALPVSSLDNENTMKLVEKHFNSVTCENEMKPESILGSGEPGVSDLKELESKLNFESADKVAQHFADYNEKNPSEPIKMRGHVFVWHSQTPTWWFRKDFKSDGAYVSKEEMNDRIDWYIKTVGTHFDTKFPGLIYAWDVVNEQASDAGGIRMGTDWAAIYGGSTEYITQAFKSADQYLAKDTILFYNDYNDCDPVKGATIRGFLKEIRGVLKEGRKLGAGMQGHHDMLTPTYETIETATREYAKIADVVHITELDIKSSVGFDGKDLETEFAKEGHRYKDIYEIVRKINEEHKSDPDSLKGYVQNITIWGTHDPVSWLKTSNSVGGSADGKTPQYPLLFDDYYGAKPAYWAFVDALQLEPLVHDVNAMQTDEFEYANAIRFAAGTDDVIIRPIWNADKLKVQVVVKSKKTADSEIILYVDPANSKGDKTDDFVRESATGENLKAVDGGYKAEFEVPMTLNPLDKVSFDVVVKKDGNTYSYNDTTNNQENSSKYYAVLSMKPFMVIKKGSAIIDGDIAEWKDIPASKLEVKSSSALTTTAETKVSWDADNLYVMLDVTDDALDATASDAYQQDSTEIFIDELNEKSGSFDDNDKQYRVSYKNLQTFNGTSCKAENIVSATKEKEDGKGYYIEAAIKWTALSPKAGKLIGLDVQINDAKDGSRLGTLNWYDASGNGYQNPSVYGTAVLADGVITNQDAVDAVKELINAIGKVELVENSKALIDAARKAYDALTEDQKKLILAEELKVLTDAEATYDALDAAAKAEAEKKAKEDAAKADAVKKAIAAIGKVDASEDSKAKVEAARKAYAALTEDQKKLVEASQLKLLTEAEAAYQQAVEESKKPTEETKPEDATKYVAKFSAKSTSIQKRKSSTNLAKDIAITAGDKIVKWETSNKKVVTVTNKGKITGKKVGKATITVTTDKGAKASITVYVKAKKVATTKVTVKNAKTDRVVKKVTLKKGKKLTLKVVTNPITTPDKVTFKSSKKNVATVTNKGVITAKKKGKATITVKSGKKTAKVQITVK